MVQHRLQTYRCLGSFWKANPSRRSALLGVLMRDHASAGMLRLREESSAQHKHSTSKQQQQHSDSTVNLPHHAAMHNADSCCMAPGVSDASHSAPCDYAHDHDQARSCHKRACRHASSSAMGPHLPALMTDTRSSVTSGSAIRAITTLSYAAAGSRGVRHAHRQSTQQ